MNYMEKFTAEELAEYEVVQDWTKFSKLYFKYDSLYKTYGTVLIENKIFDIDTDLVFNGEYSGDVTFINCHFKHGITFGSAKFHKKFAIFNCTLDGVISTTEISVFHSGFSITKSTIGSILITKGEFGSCAWNILGSSNLSISGGIFADFDITMEGKIDCITIVANKISGDLFIDGCGNVVDSFKLRGISKNLSLFINDIVLGELSVSLFTNENKLKLARISGVEKGGLFFVSNSYLGKTEFNSIDFKDFSKVAIEDSSLVECSFNNVMWSSNVNGALPRHSIYNDPRERPAYHKRSRETFRQLKHAMSKQGDVINEQRFHAIEMSHYYKILSWKNDFWTKLIIRLSFITSDFGQSFWRPLLLIFVFHTALFLPLVFSGFFIDFEFSLTHFSWDALEKGINSYFFLMNPFRKVDEGMFKSGWILIDIFMRISASYMIYNMVRATRRFIK